ncbi:MAG: PEP/pyruvate-binding domain-containing protein [Chloroflexota bacterium]|nr:PEP/pyruvate-binding domain-containing protein [Chloroflexota bacterium]
MNDYVLPFDRCGAAPRSVIGGKSHSLGVMAGAGFPVPPGFAITTGAYRHFLQSTGLSSRLNECLALEEPSGAVRDLFCDGARCAGIDEAILDGYRSLGSGPVAVRSSAADEDLADASFAGQQETFLWVQGEDQVLRKVRECWASLFSAPALAYRHRLGLDHGALAMGVTVQRMVLARCAGVAFTLNPINGDRSKIVIEGSFGLGVAVVGGEVNPDRFLLDKVTLRLLERTINRKPIAYRPELRDVPEDQQLLPCLSDEEVIELAKVSKRIEAHYGAPQDIEWALDDAGAIFLLQARQETVWSRKPATPRTQVQDNPLGYVVSTMLTPQRLSDAG